MQALPILVFSPSLSVASALSCFYYFLFPSSPTTSHIKIRCVFVLCPNFPPSWPLLLYTLATRKFQAHAFSRNLLYWASVLSIVVIDRHLSQLTSTTAIIESIGISAQHHNSIIFSIVWITSDSLIPLSCKTHNPPKHNCAQAHSRNARTYGCTAPNHNLLRSRIWNPVGSCHFGTLLVCFKAPFWLLQQPELQVHNHTSQAAGTQSPTA